MLGARSVRSIRVPPSAPPFALLRRRSRRPRVARRPSAVTSCPDPAAMLCGAVRCCCCFLAASSRVVHLCRAADAPVVSAVEAVEAVEALLDRRSDGPPPRDRSRTARHRSAFGPGDSGVELSLGDFCEAHHCGAHHCEAHHCEAHPTERVSARISVSSARAMGQSIVHEGEGPAEHRATCQKYVSASKEAAGLR